MGAYHFDMRYNNNMTKTYSKNDKVKWEWGSGTASGTVETVSFTTTHIQSKGSKITRNGTEDDPAVIIKQDDGTKVLKLASELK